MESYEVEITTIETYVIKVEAESENEAAKKAELEFDNSEEKYIYHADSDRKTFVYLVDM